MIFHMKHTVFKKKYHFKNFFGKSTFLRFGEQDPIMRTMIKFLKKENNLGFYLRFRVLLCIVTGSLDISLTLNLLKVFIIWKFW